MFDGAFAIIRVLLVVGDGFLAELQRFAVIVEEAAVVGVVFILSNQAGGVGIDEVGIEVVAFVSIHQGEHGFLVFLDIIEDAIDELVSLVVVKECAFLVVLHVEADELLEDLQAFDDGLVAIAQVGFDEVLVVEPPEFRVPSGIEVVGRLGFTVVFGDAVEEEVEHGGFIFHIVIMVFLEEAEVIFGVGLLQLLDGLEGFGIMLVDQVEESLFVPIFHLLGAYVAINSQVFHDGIFVLL